MACSDYAGDLQTAWVDGAYIDAVMCGYTMQIGDFVFGMFIMVPLLAALYLYSGNVAVPLTVTMITGSVGIAMLPSGVQRAAGIGIVLLTALALWLLANRTRTSG